MHLPEGSLAGGSLAGFGGELRIRVDIGEREVAPHVADVAEAGEQLTDDGLCLSAVRALEVAVLDNGHQGVLRPADVIAVLIDVCGQVDDEVRGAEQSTAAGRGWQQLSDAEDDPGREGGAQSGGEDADLRLLKLAAAEGKGRDQERHREADPGDGAAP